MAGSRAAALLWRGLFGPVGRIIPFGLCRRLARPIGLAAWRLGLRRSVVRRNLALAFPELSEGERERIGRESTVNLFTVFLELLTLRHLSDRELRSRLTISNLELLRTIGPEGAMLLSGHFGNWELLAFGAAAQAGVPFNVIVKDQNDHGQLERMRTSRGNRLIPTSRAAREATSILREGGVLAMLADQSASEGECLVSMFGIPTWAFAAPARLVLRYRPRLIVGFAARDAEGGYSVRLEEISHNDLPDTPEGARHLTQRYLDRLESATLLRPELWLWQHRRWKHSPGVRYE